MKHWTLVRCACWLVIALILSGCGGAGVVVGPPLDPAVRHAAMDKVVNLMATFTHVDLNAENQQLLALMRTQPEFADVELEADQTVWGRFTDGTFLLVPNNRIANPAASKGIVARPALAADLPSGRTATVFDSMGTAFAHPGTLVIPVLENHGYTISGGTIKKGTVEDFKALGGSLFYMDAHGGTSKDLNGKKFFGVFTGTIATPANDVLYADDLKSGRLTYMVSFVDLNPDKTFTIEKRYAVTGSFINQYIKMDPNSLVVLNACSSAAKSISSAFVNVGTSMYLGWRDPVEDTSATDMAKYVFDRLLGDGQVEPINNPILPPMTISELQADVKTTIDPNTNRPYGISKSTNAPLIFISGSGTLAIATPSIRDCTVDGTTGNITITGYFGSTPGTVDENGTGTAPGTNLQIVSWTSSQIVAKYDSTTASVIVRSAGLYSNSKAVDSGTWKLTGPNGGQLSVQDELWVYLDGLQIYNAKGNNFGPISFKGIAGQSLRIKVDTYQTFGDLSDLYLVPPGGTAIPLLLGNTGLVPAPGTTTVIDSTFKLIKN